MYNNLKINLLRVICNKFGQFTIVQVIPCIEFCKMIKLV